MYIVNTTVRLPDTDAAGILFFGNYFRLVHDAYETLMKEAGFGLDYVIREADFLPLIAHSEADYHRPLPLGEKITIYVKTEKLSQSSFVLTYNVQDAQGNTAATLKTVHVTIDKQSRRKVPLPDKLRRKLAEIR